MRHASLALVLFLVPLVAAAAQETSHRRWALIADEEVAECGLLDLLTAKLSQHDALELVEREQLQIALRELELSTLLSPARVAQRLQLGQTLKAQSLMILRVDRRAQTPQLQVIVVDADLGVRLWDGSFRYQEQLGAEPLVEHCVGVVEEVRQRFGGGVIHMVAVPAFLSQEFEQHFDYLQTRYRDLLVSSLVAHPGVAMVEIEEARAILRELEVTLRDGLQRPIASVVRGSYRIKPAGADGRRRVELKIEVTHGESPPEQISQTLALESAGRWLAEDFARQLLSTSEGRRPELSPLMQRDILCRHAQRFAELGNWEQSISLREAALVVDPQNALQRGLVVSEYQHRHRPERNAIWQLQQQFKQLPARRQESELRRAADDYVAGLQHLAHLIRNRQIGRVDAIGLFGKQAWYEASAVRASSPNDPARLKLMQTACAAQREFIRETYPMVDDLPNRRLLPKHLSEPYYGGRYELTTHVTNDVTFNNYDAPSLAGLGDLLLRVLPADGPTSDNLLGLLGHTNVPQPGEAHHAAWHDLLEKLTNSERELPRLYGRFALAVEQKRRERSGEELERLLAEVTDLSRAEEPIGKVIRLKLGRPPIQPRTPPSAALPKGNLGPLGRMQLEPIALRVEGEATGSDPPRLIGMIACGEFDAYWSKDRFFVMHEPGVLREWKLTPLEANHRLFWEVSWDGECIWLHAYGQGIIAMRPDGTRAATFKGKTPSYGKGHKLLGLSPRRALVAGCFGDTSRAWCGLLEIGDGGESTVNVFFEAKQVPEGKSSAEAAANVNTAFQPVELCHLRHVTGKQYVLIDRGNGLPHLQVDLDTLNVTTPAAAIGSAGMFTRTDLGFTGRLFLADGRKLDVPSSVAVSTTSRQIVYHDGWLYRPGCVWMRQHVQTGALERLQANSLPQTYWRLTARSSAHYGLIALDDSPENPNLSQITILPQTGNGRPTGGK